MKAIKTICTLFILGFGSISHAEMTFITEKDENNNVTSLLGANNVEVEGSFYNVRFLSGSCTGLFNGCDDADDFLFNTTATSSAAAEALLDKVFIDGVNGNFDSTPTLTNGCNDSLECRVYQPFRMDGVFFWYGTVATNGNFSRGNSISERNYLRDGDVSGLTTYAVWSVPAEVAGPNAGMLFLISIAGLLVSKRRKEV